MSQIVIGTGQGIQAGAVAAISNHCLGWGRDSYDCAQNNRPELQLRDTGFHADFQDGYNQVFHFWASLASVGGARIEIERAVQTGFNRVAFQTIHEGVQGWLCQQDLPGGDFGSSWQDFALTEMAFVLGEYLFLDVVQPIEVGAWLRNNLGQNGPGWINAIGHDPLLSTLYSIGPNDTVSSLQSRMPRPDHILCGTQVQQQSFVPGGC
jgi:hypothetical protein